MQEQIFLQENGVTVSQVRFVTSGQTFAIQGITSVAHNVFRPSRKWATFLIVSGVILTLISFGVFSASIEAGMAVLFIALLFALGPGLLRIRALSKPDHQVVLNASTTAGTSRTIGGGMLGGSFAVGAAVTGSTSQNFVIALSSKDGEFISRVVDALNEALVARG